MKLKLFSAAVLLASLTSAFAQTKLLGPSAVVKEVLQMGSNWGNGNAGGFLFRTMNMPADIDYYIVRPTDVALFQYLSQAELSLVNGRAVIVEYRRINTACTNPSPGACNKYEGDVSSIFLY